MIRRFIPGLKDLLGWWPSLYQSVENPLQPARLPDTSGIELEYPTRHFTPEQDRRHTWRILFLAAICGAVLSLIDEFYDLFWMGHSALSALAAVAMYLFLVPYFQKNKPWWRWILYLLVGPCLFAALVVFRDSTLQIGLAMLLCIPATDLFATHYFFQKTAVPVPRERSRRLRALWAKRNSLFHPAPHGVELYPLSWLAIPAAWAVLFYYSCQPVTGRFLANLPPVLLALALLIFLPLVLEIITAFLFARKYVPPLAMLRAFSTATVQWFTYNRHNSLAPGSFQSPAGTYRARRWMSLALMLIFTTAVIPMFSTRRDAYAQADAAKRDPRVRQLRTFADRINEIRWFRLPEGPITSPTRTYSTPEQVITAPAPFPPLTQQPSIGDPPDRPTPPAPVQESRRSDLFRPKAKPEPKAEDDLKLEPYQKAMLKRMPPEQRKQQLEQLRKQQSAPSATDADEPDSLKSLTERTGVRFFLGLLLFIPIWFLRISYFLLCGILPPLFFLACCFATSARVAGFWGRELGAANPDESFSTLAWDSLVRRVQASQDEDEQQSLILGVNAFDDTPVLVPRAVFHEHAHLLGDSGSGKTALGLASLIAQLIRFHDSSVVILDLKGDDLALFEGARIEAHNAKLPFRWFTNELNRSTYLFNPLTQRHFSTLSLYQRTDVLTASMGLQYGTDYGRSYYSDANNELLYQTLLARPDIATFGQLAEALETASQLNIDRELRRAASHLRATVNRLAAFEPLNCPAADGDADGPQHHAIEFADLFVTPQVLYFYLPAALGSTSSAEIARLALYSLLSAAKSLGTQRKQVYLFIDEFQRIVAHNLELILQTARSMNISVILANQTLMDLKTPSTNLIPTVRANTRYKQIFAASDLAEQQEIVYSSGETIIRNRTWSEYLGAGVIFGGAASLAHSETVTPRLRPNDVLLASDHPLQSIVYITRGKAYAQFGGLPFVMTSAFHITPGEYELRRTAAWPERPEETITPPLRLPPAGPTPRPGPRRPRRDGDDGWPSIDDTEPGPDPVIGTPATRIETAPDAAPRPTTAAPKFSDLDVFSKPPDQSETAPHDSAVGPSSRQPHSTPPPRNDPKEHTP